MKNKIKILGIAPYEGMKAMLQKLAAQRDNIELTVYVGDMNEGVKIASRHTLDDYDVILSRGGTAELISSISPIPVVEVELSVYDILRAMKLAENYSERYAIVGFPAITRSAQFLCDLLQYNIDIYTVHDSDQVYHTLTQLSSQGYRMVLCDVITNSQALRLGMRSILFTSGTESIEEALDQAVKAAGTYEGLISKAEFFRTLLEDYSYHIFVYDEQGELVYLSKDHTFSSAITSAMKNSVPEILSTGGRKFYRDEGGILVALRGFRKVIHKQTYVVYYVNTRKVPLSLIRNGIRYIDREQACDEYYSSFYGMTNLYAPIKSALDKISQTDDPVMILGEDGTGKGATACLIYIQSRFQNKPLVIIDCSRIRPNGWTFLTSHTNSPFSDTSTTIYIRELEFLSQDQFRELFSIIRDLKLHKRNRILFSYTLKENQPIPEECQLVINHFSCICLKVPPLRSQSEEISNLVNLSISSLNMQLAREILGMEPEAVRLLQEYSWPHNYNQFCRIMKELVLMAHTPYITASSVSKILLKEEPGPQTAAPSQTGLDLRKILEEIQLDIIRRVLAEEEGNQSTAAKRLGISRTTLWRMIKKLS